MRTLVMPAVVLSLSVLAGCAQPYTRDQVDGRYVCNPDYVDQVERAAQRHFAEVHWVNCPTARLRVVNG
jgi:hypothetical protein